MTTKELFNSVANLSDDDLIKLSYEITTERTKRKNREINEWVEKVNDLLSNCPVDIESDVRMNAYITFAYYDEELDVVKFAD